MRISFIVAALLSSCAFAGVAVAAELEGPERFCGYSPIIDLLPGEKITTLEGGIHGGSFRWDGLFGTLTVRGIGWASEPSGTAEKQLTSKGHIRFTQRRDGDVYKVALWNKAHGAAYFISPKPLTKAQFAAIDRVDLFEEGEDPKGCTLRTAFSWE